MLLSTVLDRAISTKFLNHRVSLQSTQANFQKNFVLPEMVAILNFRIFVKISKHKNAYILKTVLDRADYADFGCHNSIRLEAEHFLNTPALTFISFSGRFVMSADWQVSWHYGITLRRPRLCTRPRDKLLLQNYKTQRHAVFLKDTLTIEDDKS